MQPDELQDKIQKSIELVDTESSSVENSNYQFFMLINVEKSKRPIIFCPKYSHILFLLKGSATITDRNSLTTQIKASKGVFIPKNERFSAVVEEDVTIVLMRFSYRTFMPSGHEIWDDCSENIEYAIHPVLDLHPFISNILVGIMQSQELLSSVNYQRIKAEEIHEVARNCYPARTRSWFCQSVIRPKDDFRSFVEIASDKAKTCAEMAIMAGMSETPFRILFKKTFGETFHVWLMKQRKEKMKKLIINGKRDHKQLMAALNFAHRSSYVRFCNEWMGDDPSVVVKRILNEANAI